MDVFILDSQLRRSQVVDRFESCIWTERYSSFGDFELVIHSTVESRNMLVADSLLAIHASKRVMKIETIVDKDDAEGRSMLTLTGRSLEVILQDRPTRIPGHAPFVFTGVPAYIARQLFRAICANNPKYAADNIPFYTEGSIYPPDTIPEPDVSQTITIPSTNVYAAIKEICDVNGLGFRLVRDRDTSKLYFNIYSGTDRTATQTTNSEVIFSPDIENLTDVSELYSTEKYKNVAYVFTPNGSGIVYAIGADENTVGFDRRVLSVYADDITLPAGAALNAAIQQRGKDELAKNRSLSAIDGELPQTSKYIYDTHYSLGDLVEMRNADGVTNRMRISEQIFVSDSTGDRSYPALSQDLFITAGSWYAWDSGQVWDNATGTWDSP